jgi:hypothetical protein
MLGTLVTAAQWIAGTLGIGMPPTHEATPYEAAGADPNHLASQALDALGAQREMPGLSASHGWSLFFKFQPGWIADAIALAVLVLCLGLIVASVLRGRARREAAWQQTVAIADNPAGAASPHLDRAEHFAREGRFAEAIHELLLQALADIRALHGAALAPSLTSREILREPSLADTARAALRLLIGRVEWTYFGLRAAESADYLAGRADLDQLRHALRPA